MKNTKFLVLSLLAAFACGPQNKQEPENQQPDHQQPGGESGENQNKDGDVTVSWMSDVTAFDMPCDKDTVRVQFTLHKGDDYNQAWTAESSASWCTVKPTSGTGGDVLQIMVADNGSADVRTATISLKSGSSVSTLTVNQSLFGGAKAAEPWFTTNYWERTDREKAGLRGPVKSIYEDHYTTFYKYYYDEAGHLVKEEYHNLTENTVEERWLYEYDSNGRLAKKVSGDGVFTFTFEYGNTGKLVPTDPFNWVPIYVSGKDYPLTIFKDLSAIHYLDNSPYYYEKADYTFEFGSDGNLTVTETFQNGMEGQPQAYTYHVQYENGYPVSNSEYGIAATYASNGMPLTLSEENGNVRFTFLSNDRELVTETRDEPEASGMLPELWSRWKYNANADVTERKHAFYSTDQVYWDSYDKYFYDARGNWIRRTETIEGAWQKGQRIPARVGRVIEYYQ